MSHSSRATSFFHAMLRPLGLEKGKPFKPNARQTKILTDAALVGEAMAKANSADRRFAGVKYRSDAHWDFALQLDADNPGAFWNLLDERASWFYEAVGRSGDGTQASRSFIGLSRSLQGQGGPLAGWRHVVSAARSAQSAGQAVLVGHGLRRRNARTDSERAEDRRSLVAHGPAQERGRLGGHLLRAEGAGRLRAERIPTVPGKNWFAYFRFYEPTEAYFDRSWPLPDFEQV